MTRLPDLAVTSTSARLSGPRAAIAIESPMPHVLRVRHAPTSSTTSATHPELPPKRSFAVIAEGAQPIEVASTADVVHVRAPGVSLEIARATGAWIFRDERGRELAGAESFDGEARPAFPIDAHRARIALAAPPGEAYLGFGEKVGPLDKRGAKLVFWNTDAFPPQPDTDPLYVSIPFFVALRDGIAWGLFLDETWRSEVDVACEDPSRVTWESWGAELDVHLVAGPHPTDVVRRYAALTGRPAFPPLWSLGAQQSRWGFESDDDVRAVVRGYRARALPLDAVYVDVDAMDAFKVWTWDRARFGDLAALARDLRDDGVRLVPIVDPGVKAEPGYFVYDEARARDLLVRTDRGDALVGEVWPDPAVFPDLTRDEAQRWWGDLHRPFVEAGIAGVWNDMNEPSCFSVHEPRGVPAPTGTRAPGVGTREGSTLPYEARHGARRHLEVHNVYGLGMARAAFEGLARAAPDRRPFVLTRAGFAGVQRWAAVWTGDFGSHWTHLEASIPMLLGMSVSGLPFVGADVPGFLGRASGELLARWMQLATFYPLMRNHSARGTPRKEPWRFGEPFLAIARAALERRYRLLPLLYTLMREAAETGIAPLRPLVYADPGDGDALRAFDQLLFGDDLLVAPVVRPGQTKRMAYLPAGDWLELANLDRRGARVSGKRWVIADAPLDVVPVWLRAGGAVPLTEPAPCTSTARWGALTWEVHAAPRVRGRLYEDEGDGADDAPGRWTEIEGALDGGGLLLERRTRGSVAPSRGAETLRIHGIAPPRAITGAIAQRPIDGGVEIDVDAEWRRVEVAL